MVSNIVDFPAQGLSTSGVTREMTFWERRLLYPVKNLPKAFHRRWGFWRHVPVLMWRGDAVDVTITITSKPLGAETSTVFQIENLLRLLDIGFDTGSGAGGRDWEFDWSLHGPIQVTFQGKCKTTDRRGDADPCNLPQFSIPETVA